MNKVWVYDHVDNKVDEMNLEKFRELYNNDDLCFHETSIFFNKEDAKWHQEQNEA